MFCDPRILIILVCPSGISFSYVNFIVLDFLVFYCIALYCLVLYCHVLYYIVFYCIVLHSCMHCIVLLHYIFGILLYYILFYCIVLYCIVLACDPQEEGGLVRTRLSTSSWVFTVSIKKEKDFVRNNDAGACRQACPDNVPLLFDDRPDKLSLFFGIIIMTPELVDKLVRTSSAFFSRVIIMSPEIVDKLVRTSSSFSRVS